MYIVRHFSFKDAGLNTKLVHLVSSCHLSYLPRSLFYHIVLCLLSILKSTERPRPPFSSGVRSLCAHYFCTKVQGWFYLPQLFRKFLSCLFILLPCSLNRYMFRDVHCCLSIELDSASSQSRLPRSAASGHGCSVHATFVLHYSGGYAIYRSFGGGFILFHSVIMPVTLCQVQRLAPLPVWLYICATLLAADSSKQGHLIYFYLFHRAFTIRHFYASATTLNVFPPCTRLLSGDLPRP